MSNSTIDGEILQLPIEEIYIEKYKDNVQTKQVKEKLFIEKFQNKNKLIGKNISYQISEEFIEKFQEDQKNL